MTNVFGAKSKQSQKPAGAKPYICKPDTIRQPLTVRLVHASLFDKRQPIPTSLAGYFANPPKLKGPPAWRVKQLKEAKKSAKLR